jgi:CRISPR/Cas system-associated exonuclease Cas4 (RecB family)
MLDRNWIPDGYTDAKHEARNRSHAVEILTRFHRDNAASYALPAALEERFEIDVDGVRVSGQIDRMDRLPDGGYEIIDYKTSRRLPDLATVEESLQLSMYHLAAREKWGIDPERLTLYFVVHGQPMSTPGRTDAQIDAVRRHVVTIAERIDAGRFEPKQSKLCDYCDYQPICPVFRNAGERLRGESDAEIGAAVDEWVRLADEAASIRERMRELETTLLPFSLRHDYARLFTAEGPGIERRRREVRTDEERVRRALGALGRLDEVLSVDAAKVARFLEGQDIPPEVEDELLREAETGWELRRVDRPARVEGDVTTGDD